MTSSSNLWRSLAALSLPALVTGLALGQQTTSTPDQDSTAVLRNQVSELTALVQKLQARVDDLEGRLPASHRPVAGASSASLVQPAQPEAASSDRAVATAADPAPNLLGGTTVNILFDGYYGYNFNNPIGRVNLLRGYDVSSNSFSLSQADLVLENAPDPAHGKRFGLRIDLQYGQATATLQGSASNEPRPEVYRNIFQAYGTYVAPLGRGLTIDFGKWASSLGMEGNYAKDQINYSRSFWFSVLPFYHMGGRFNYKVNDTLSLNYWITNGTQQTEPFNSFKDQMAGVSIQPRKNIAWTVNYYIGQEHPDFRYVPGSAQEGLPTMQGIPFVPIPNAPKGKLHIFDSYATWAVTPRLTLAGEADYVVQRLETTSPPAHTTGGAAYLRYQLSPRVAVAGRAEYVSDRGGLYTGVTQALKETTVTLEQKISDGFLLREEWRRDFSNNPYFLTDTLGVLKKEQNTATLGMIWWFGGKEGSW
jgi:hypothetical protein